MINHITGILTELTANGKIILDVNGIGYELESSLLTSCELSTMINSKIKLYVHMVVREDAFLLFAFLKSDERSLFRTLIKINGIGPKVALSILSHISPIELTECILSNNLSRLVKIPGIGKKTAERLLIEIKDKISTIEIAEQFTLNQSSSNVITQEAISGLVSLGYKHQDAAKMINKIDDGTLSSEQLIRKALKSVAFI